MGNCPFCQNRIQEVVFDDTRNFMALYNIAPIFPGHSLIVPRRHVQSVMELTTPEFEELMDFTRRVTVDLLDVFKANAFNWTLQDREAAGQTLAHLHVHIVLRFPNDLPDPGDWYPLVKQNYGEILDSAHRPHLADKDMQTIVHRLRHRTGFKGE